MALTAVTLTACSGTTAETDSQAAGVPRGPRKRGGSFRFASASFNEATGADPELLGGGSSFPCYDQLVKWDANQQLKLELADEFAPQPGDPSTWTIRVRDGVEFHNGKTLGADDVMFTIRRILDPKLGAAAAALLGAIDPAGLTKLDKRTVRLKLKYPNSQLADGFTSFCGVVPVGFDPRRPVGTGAFRQESFIPHQRWAGTRNPHYWRPDSAPYLDRVEMLSLANPVAAVNALLSGQVDAIDNVLISQLPRLKQSRNVAVVESQTGSVQFVSMNCRKGQLFEDARVRKAFKLMLDRQQLVNTVYSGHGAIGNDVGVFPQWDPACAPDLPRPEQNLERARQLLREAGKEGMTVPLRVAELLPGMTETAQVLIEQAKKIGVTITLDQVRDNAQFYTGEYYKAQLQIDYASTMSMYGGAEYYWLSDSGYNAAGYADPEVDSLFKEALKHTGAGYETPMRKMSRIIQDEGPWLVWGRQNVFSAFNRKFTGITAGAGGGSLSEYGLWNVSLA
ncbi:ABC transporter substrate-binding protein [Amycolatopsis sp. Poz14]|uniref:ABC transporter substrate-binding protein n=1 Tax=Amycolatopsis sp. Poz14 TaxID=1447705 RepID=UPI001EE8F14C|nr:ABC transporter substrate-binding protein [Amycolatopsis sp. Poz14]MCG3754070.1 ABC transporter substrate-binding protein [Amycolatopsis sp. Poz14]